MICIECQDLLSDFLDGDLSDSSRKAVNEHLRGCRACATLRDDLARIIEASANLPLHTPSTQVWERIQQEIGGGNVVAGPPSWWRQLAARRFDVSISAQQIVAAAATLVIATGVLWTIKFASPNALPSVAVNWSSVGGSKDPVAAQTLADVPARNEVTKFRATVDDMARSVTQRQAQWSPELRATFAKNLAEIDARMAECERAYAADGTEASRKSLMAVYSEKLLFLDDFARIGKSAPESKNQPK